MVVRRLRLVCEDEDSSVDYPIFLGERVPDFGSGGLCRGQSKRISALGLHQRSLDQGVC